MVFCSAQTLRYTVCTYMYKQDTGNMFNFYVYTVMEGASGQALSVFKVLYGVLHAAPQHVCPTAAGFRIQDEVS